ncbi:MAG: hypothetical protein VW378_03375 [bacterium]
MADGLQRTRSAVTQKAGGADGPAKARQSTAARSEETGVAFAATAEPPLATVAEDVVAAAAAPLETVAKGAEEPPIRVQVKPKIDAYIKSLSSKTNEGDWTSPKNPGDEVDQLLLKECSTFAIARTLEQKCSEKTPRETLKVLQELDYKTEPEGFEGMINLKAPFIEDATILLREGLTFEDIKNHAMVHEIGKDNEQIEQFMRIVEANPALKSELCTALNVAQETTTEELTKLCKDPANHDKIHRAMLKALYPELSLQISQLSSQAKKALDNMIRLMDRSGHYPAKFVTIFQSPLQIFANATQFEANIASTIDASPTSNKECWSILATPFNELNIANFSADSDDPFDNLMHKALTQYGEEDISYMDIFLETKDSKPIEKAVEALDLEPNPNLIDPITNKPMSAVKALKMLCIQNDFGQRKKPCDAVNFFLAQGKDALQKQLNVMHIKTFNPGGGPRRFECVAQDGVDQGVISRTKGCEIYAALLPVVEDILSLANANNMTMDDLPEGNLKALFTTFAIEPAQIGQIEGLNEPDGHTQGWAISLPILLREAEIMTGNEDIGSAVDTLTAKVAPYRCY